MYKQALYFCAYNHTDMALRAKFKLNIEQFEARIRVNQNAFVKQMITDASEYLARKIREDIISGQYVGVRTGRLREGTKAETQDYKAVVFSEMDYTKYVLAWSEGKYGKSYLDMAISLYGGNIVKTVQEEAKKIYGKKYVYKNPFT